MDTKLIILNGPCGIGKSTIAQKYINDHPMALAIEIDELIVMLGQWNTHEAIARPLAIELAKQMAQTHLKAHYDVIIPYIIISADIAQAFEEIAKKEQVRFFEFALMADKTDSIGRMLERGTWGEQGSSPLTKNDIPTIEDRYDQMQKVLQTRPKTIKINSIKNTITKTYEQMLKLL